MEGAPIALKPLDARESRFVDEYLISLNPREAAIAAGYAVTTATNKAFTWVSESGCAKPHVFAEIEKRKAERSKRTNIDADWVLRRLAQEAEADIADLYDEKGALKPIREWPLIWRQGLVAGVDVTTEYQTIDGERVASGAVAKIKVSDRVRRLELIGKHISVMAFRDQLGLSDPQGNPLETEKVSDKELARRIAYILTQATAQGEQK